MVGAPRRSAEDEVAGAGVDVETSLLLLLPHPLPLQRHQSLKQVVMAQLYKPMPPFVYQALCHYLCQLTFHGMQTLGLLRA